MKRFKKLAAVLVACTMLITSAGCQGDSASVSGSSDTTASVSEQTGSAEESSYVTTSDSEEPQESTASSDQSTSSAPTSEQETSSQPTEQTTASSESSTSGSSPEQSTSSAAITTASTSTATSASQDTQPQEAEFAVSCTASNSWQEDGKTCTQLEFIISNNSSKTASGWTVTAPLGQNVEVMQSWNVNVSANGSNLVCTNVDYNADIPNGAQTSFGVIVKTPSAIKQPANMTIIIGKTTAGVTNSGGNNGGSVTTTATTFNEKPPTAEEIEVTGKYGLVSDIGQLSVKGANLVGADGTPAQLRGVSTHGIYWFPQFANKDIFKYLRDEWNINTIRIAMYSGESEGYTASNRANIEKMVQNAVEACIQLDMYVIIDWHVLADGNPQKMKSEALVFFDYMSEKYASYPNVIYEICNEPNGGVTWDGHVKPYAEEVIPVIRRNDPDSVIIVGTPTWSQDIDKALANPLKYDNVMYALHYYAATHKDWLRDRVRNCYNSGLPIFVSEFGNCDASGNGSNDLNEARKWLELLDSLNISYMNWSLCDKSEAASLLAPGASTTGGWTDANLTENGKFMRDWFKNHS